MTTARMKAHHGNIVASRKVTESPQASTIHFQQSPCSIQQLSCSRQPRPPSVESTTTAEHCSVSEMQSGRVREETMDELSEKRLGIAYSVSRSAALPIKALELKHGLLHTPKVCQALRRTAVPSRMPQEQASTPWAGDARMTHATAAAGHRHADSAEVRTHTLHALRQGSPSDAR